MYWRGHDHAVGPEDRNSLGCLAPGDSWLCWLYNPPAAQDIANRPS